MSCECNKPLSFVLLPPTRIDGNGKLDLLLSVDLGGYKSVHLTVLVLSFQTTSGTPNLNVVGTTADVNEGPYFTNAFTFSAIDGEDVQALTSAELGRFLSAQWTVTGGACVAVVTIVGTAKG